MEEFVKDQEDFFDPEQEQRLRESVKECILKFFKNKPYYCGGAIPIKSLCSQDNIDLILNTEFDAGIKFCYEKVLANVQRPLIKIKQLETDWQIEFVLQTLADCRKNNIPIIYQAGFVLLYLKFCYGQPEISSKCYSSWKILDAIAA